jgi:hypothetical protein
MKVIIRKEAQTCLNLLVSHVPLFVASVSTPSLESSRKSTIIGAHCDPNISQINDKFRIPQINISPLCGISRMSHFGILLMLLFVPS